MSLRLELGKGLEQTFRKAAMETFGYEKGSLKKAAEEAFLLWIAMEKHAEVPKVEDPLRLVKGMLSSLRGKYTSVQLQHEAKKLWTEK